MNPDHLLQIGYVRRRGVKTDNNCGVPRYLRSIRPWEKILISQLRMGQTRRACCDEYKQCKSEMFLVFHKIHLSNKSVDYPLAQENVKNDRSAYSYRREMVQDIRPTGINVPRHLTSMMDILGDTCFLVAAAGFSVSFKYAISWANWIIGVMAGAPR